MCVVLNVANTSFDMFVFSTTCLVENKFMNISIHKSFSNFLHKNDISEVRTGISSSLINTLK